MNNPPYFRIPQDKRNIHKNFAKTKEKILITAFIKTGCINVLPQTTLSSMKT